jgi:hypothetical protein
MPKKSKSMRDGIKDTMILELLDEPVGSPIPPLTREQALEIVNAGMGTRPDLPSGAEYVRRIWRGRKARD